MPDSIPVLTRLAVNRALLARQQLLERSPSAPAAMVERLVGQQAQNPRDPYLGLAARLTAFEPRTLSEALERREVVRMGLLRTTLHLVTAADAVAMWPILENVLARTWANTSFRRDLAGVDLAAIVDEAREFVAAAPRSGPEIRAHLARRWPDRPAASLASVARYHLPVVQVPPRGLWGRTGRPSWQLLDTWLAGADVAPPAGAPPLTVDGLVRRYLAAFGPATAADVATWSWLTGIREVLKRLRPTLRIVRDEGGRELWDVPDGPLPDPATPAPPRFLPEYDNLLLSHQDRTRVIPPELAGRFTGYVGTFLVDGFVAGQWRLDRARTGVTLVLEPFGELRPADRDAVVDEGRRLAALHHDGDGQIDVTFGVARPPDRSSRRPRTGEADES